jgi:hypothetical protein
MEHRWGRRFPVDLPVRLVLSSGVVTWGRLRNLSVTGAFIESSLPPPLNALVYIERAGEGHWPPCAMAAAVIRHGNGGVGLEWCDPSEQLIQQVERARPRLHSAHVGASLTT